MNIDDLLAKETRRLDDIDNNEELQASPVSFYQSPKNLRLYCSREEKPTVTFLIS